jgi:hypothetical protein
MTRDSNSSPFRNAAIEHDPTGRALIATVQIDPHLERITDLMDRAIRIPGTNMRIGLDPILGLVLPQVGDAIGAVVSAYVILASLRYGLPKGIIARMVFNLGVDYLMGSIPLIGDFTDFAWKANDKNIALLKTHARGEGRSFWSDWGWAIILLAVLGAMIVGLIAFSLTLLNRISLPLI